MIKRFFMLSMVLLLAGCTEKYFEPTQADMLTAKERYAVYDYARNFLFASKKIHLTKTERERILKTDPKTRIHYTGHKKGRVKLYWDLDINRQLLVEADGNLLLLSKKDATWLVKVVQGKRLSGSKNPADYGIKE